MTNIGLQIPDQGARAARRPEPAGEPHPGGAIVVAYDGSSSSRCAVKYAAGEALRSSRPLRILTVAPVPDRASADGRGRGLVGEADGLEPARVVALTRLHYPDLTVRSEHVDGAVVDALLVHGSDEAMLVVGGRGLDRSGRLVRGAASVAVVGRSRIPVVVVPSGWPGWQPRLHPTEPVVVGVDPTHDAGELLEFALAQAAGRGVGIVTVTAVPADAGTDRITAARQRRLAAELNESLHASRADHPGVPVRSREDLECPVPALLRASLGTPLLVVGRHRSGRLGPAIGSVTREVLHRAEVPVAVIPLA